MRAAATAAALAAVSRRAGGRAGERRETLRAGGARRRGGPQREGRAGCARGRLSRRPRVGGRGHGAPVTAGPSPRRSAARTSCRVVVPLLSRGSPRRTQARAIELRWATGS